MYEKVLYKLQIGRHIGSYICTIFILKHNEHTTLLDSGVQHTDSTILYITQCS